MIDNLLEEYEDLIRETVILLSDVQDFVNESNIQES
jgi:hypothetical protein